MKRIFSLAAVAVLASATHASACVTDASGAAVVDGNGKQIKAGNSCEVMFASEVLFAYGSATLNAAGKAVLKTIDSSSVKVITGYASVDGSEKANLALSKARAQAVADYLGSNAKIIGAGETTKFGDDLESNRTVVLS